MPESNNFDIFIFYILYFVFYILYFIFRISIFRKKSSENEESANIKRALKAKKHHLSTLLSKPLFPKGFSGKYPEMNYNLDLKVNDEPQKAVEIMQKAIKEGPKKDKSKFESRSISASKLKSKMKKKKIKATNRKN